jgi:DNA helicase-2/ATP-dependent DNA helicase PcrA
MDPIKPDGMAILVRASHQMRAFEDRFLTIGMPYRVIGGPRFYERMEIRDAMAYFRVVVSPDDDLAFERIVNTPKRGLGDKAQADDPAAGARQWREPCRGCAAGGGDRRAGRQGGEGTEALLEGLARWRSMMAGAVAAPSDDLIEDMGAGDQLSHIELAEVILDESGYTAHWQNDKTPEAPGRLENLKELIKALESFENLQGFLEHVSLIMDNEQEDGEPKVTLMTLHAAKGLEFPAVFLPGWEDGLFPSQRSMDESGPEGAGRGAAACLCRHHPGRGGLHDLLRRQPPGLWPMAKPDAVPLHRRIAVGACGGADTPGLYGHQGGMAATAPAPPQA